MIENIVLSRDHRGVSGLRPYMPPDFCERAARLVLDRPGTVLIATGFFIPSAGATETDGPPGAVAVGRALATLGFGVAYVSDEFSAPVISGLVPPGTEVLAFPCLDHEASRSHAKELLARLAPSLLISIERCGLTDEGVYRNMHGVDVSSFHAKLDYLFLEHAHSVGIGDGGNEIGMGNLAPVIPIVMPATPKPSVTKTSRLVIASVSNWGAWGLVATLSKLSGRNLLPGVDEARDLLRRTAGLGAVDGVTGRPNGSVDGFPPEENDRVLGEMHAWLARHGVPAGWPVTLP
jgi:hypothetical protein